MNNENDNRRDDRESDRLMFEGVVTEASNSKFKVFINEHHSALCTLSGKIRLNTVRILVGDKVTIEVSPYDVSKGRITYRHKS